MYNIVGVGVLPHCTKRQIKFQYMLCTCEKKMVLNSQKHDFFLTNVFYRLGISMCKRGTTVEVALCCVERKDGRTRGTFLLAVVSEGVG